MKERGSRFGSGRRALRACPRPRSRQLLAWKCRVARLAVPRARPAEAKPRGLAIVKSPVVGTFYLSPEPGAPPFVQVGDTVTKGQVLCIIEAMKLMNEIDSEHGGEIVNVFVESGQPVQYGENLFAIKTG